MSGTQMSVSAEGMAAMFLAARGRGGDDDKQKEDLAVLTCLIEICIEAGRRAGAANEAALVDALRKHSDLIENLRRSGRLRDEEGALAVQCLHCHNAAMRGVKT